MPNYVYDGSAGGWVWDDPTYDPNVAGLGGSQVPTTDNVVERASQINPDLMPITPDQWYAKRQAGMTEEQLIKQYEVVKAGTYGTAAPAPIGKAQVATPVTTSKASVIADAVVVDQNGNKLGDAKTLIENQLAEIAALKAQLGGRQLGNVNRFSRYNSEIPRLVLAGYDPATIAAANEFRKSNALRSIFGFGTQMPDANSEVWKYMAETGLLPGNEGFMGNVAAATGMSEQQLKSIVAKLGSAGASGLLMALTGNFPVAAMGYFALDRMLDPSSGKELFKGALTSGAAVDGVPLARVGIDVPPELPTDIFDQYRFICYDRLTNRWWPSDEIKVLSYASNAFRWLCLDRLDGKVYQANLIMRPRIYLD